MIDEMTYAVKDTIFCTNLQRKDKEDRLKSKILFPLTSH